MRTTAIQVYSYPSEKWIPGQLIAIVILICCSVFSWYLVWDQLAGKIAISIMFFGMLDCLYQIYVMRNLVAAHIILESDRLVGEFSSGRRLEINLRNIDKIVETKSVRIYKHQFSMRIVSTHENRELVIGAYLTGLGDLLERIKTANPNCVLTSTWF